ncbi:MAG: DUF4340 domain-containing protein [Lachnospiraceae bacterium]|nr:DUF4340 domain-containing protein [Lachnospiraceae bacterium]
MKKSNIISLVALVAVAAVLLVVFLVLNNKKNNPTGDGEKENYFTVVTIDVNSVDKIVLSNKDYSGTFELRGEAWYSTEDILNQKIIAQFCDLLLPNLKALAKVENPASFGEYGLTESAAVLEAYAGDKKLVKIELGDKVPTKNRYYCRFNDENAVYTVSESYANLMQRERTYYVDSMELPSIANVRYITEVEVTGDLFNGFHAIYDRENPRDYTGKGTLSWYFTEPYREPWEADTLSGAWADQLGMYLTLYTEQVIRVKPDEYAKYGLANPRATLKVCYTNSTGSERNSYKLQIGNQDPETGSYYAKLEGIEAVLVMSNYKISMMCDVNVFSNTYHAVFYPVTTSLSKVTLSSGNITHVITHEKQGEDDVYRIDGDLMDNSEAFGIATQILSLKTTAFRPQETPSGNPILTIDVESIDPSKYANVTIRIFRGSDGIDIVERFGVCDMTMDARLTDSFIKYLGSIAP